MLSRRKSFLFFISYKTHGKRWNSSMREFNQAGWKYQKTFLCTYHQKMFLTIYSILDAVGYTWLRNLLWRSKILCISLSVMALFPLCLAVHHSPSSSMYFSKSFSNKVALGTTMAGIALAMNSTVVTLSHSSTVHFIMNDLRISPGKSPRQALPLLWAITTCSAIKVKI